MQQQNQVLIISLVGLVASLFFLFKNYRQWWDQRDEGEEGPRQDTTSFAERDVWPEEKVEAKPIRLVWLAIGVMVLLMLMEAVLR